MNRYSPGDSVLVLCRRERERCWLLGVVRSVHPTFACLDLGAPRPSRVGLDRLRLAGGC